ncbi:hypothetical protein BST97_01805 [Nonlabens spongiae]|uniref:Uncharacterized protein n=2 Tax=Nonlabens spongiae TaxID=331648 RepID=A0A1W6MGV9_9FLAO|nr:hypothetical protein BST97_01805 [Nonlabens spongiae]
MEKYILAPVFMLIVLAFAGSLINHFRIYKSTFELRRKLIVGLITLLPLLDISLGISNSIRDQIKGEIVLSIIDDGVFASSAFTIREKNQQLVGYIDQSAAGLGEIETAEVEIINDSTLTFTLLERDYYQILIYDKEHQVFNDTSNLRTYCIMRNKLMSQ